MMIDENLINRAIQTVKKLLTQSRKARKEKECDRLPQKPLHLRVRPFLSRIIRVRQQVGFSGPSPGTREAGDQLMISFTALRILSSLGSMASSRGGLNGMTVS
jgi:hypothetical protein